VNLRFISDRYGYEPDEVARMRSSGKSFVIINNELRRAKKGKDSKEGARDKKQEKQERGQKDQDHGKRQGRDKKD